MTRNSISTLFLGTGMILFAGALTMCKKDSKTCKIAPEQGHVNMDKDGVIQKDGMVKSPEYHLSDKQNYDLVKAFKAQSKNAARGGGGGTDPDPVIDLDSAQYLLESSINFDFDSYGGSAMLEVHQDFSNYPFNDDATHPGSGFINSAKVNEIYNELRARFNALVSTTVKISAIDVVAYIDDASTGQGHFEVTASVMQTNAVGNPYKCTATVWSPGGNYANCSWAEINSVFSCGLFTFPAGLTGVRAQFQAEMNCRSLVYIGCDNGYYFPVVTTVSVSAVPGDARLYYGPTVNALRYCDALGGTTLTGAVYNSKLANAKSFVLNNCYVSGLDLVDNSTVINKYGYSISQTANGVMYWELVFQKGVRHCRPDPID